ncbi:MAG: ShlB/FhaC/HecB family hemolysin secretion/activation protein [Schwartzia sp.]|nr:ShlB/FhaC/HecB family hemolysin secretion/activation protein [Schwartzia sp. (in: firmicutes)]
MNLHGFKKTMLLSAGLFGLLGGMAAAAPQDTAGNPTHAQEELAREERALHERAAKEEAKVNSPTDFSVKVTGVIVAGNKRMTEDEVKALLPELKKDTVNIRRLSRQIQMVNDTGSMKLGADFRPSGDSFQVTVSVEEKKSERVNVTVDNAGNIYTGDWRATVSYLATNATHHADTFGAALVSSPGHWDDVKQAALSYRMLFPKESGSLLFTASWSDVDLGSIYAEPGLLNYTAGGRSIAVGVHGQKYLSYTSRNKDFWDFGLDHKSYDNDNTLTFLGQPINFDYNFAVAMLSAHFIHTDRSNRHAFTYSVGAAANLGGSKDDYRQATPMCDNNFVLWKAAASYQHRTPGDWIFGARLHGQYTSSNVVSTEQLGAGGLYTVRGFNERTISADTGLIGSLEIFTPEFVPHSRFVVFADYGALHNNNEYLAFGSETLGSVGLGYRYYDDRLGLSLRLEYAKIVDDVNRDLLGNEGHKNWNLVLTKSF